MFSWHTFGPLIPINHHLNATAYLNIVADHVHLFMATMYPSSNDYFQHDNAPCQKAKVVSSWFHEHINGFSVLQWSSQSQDLNPIEHLWDVVELEIRSVNVQLTNLQKLWMSTSNRSSKNPCHEEGCCEAFSVIFTHNSLEFLRYLNHRLAPTIIPRSKSLRSHFLPIWPKKQLNLLTTSACFYVFSCCHMTGYFNICINKLVYRST